LAHFARRQYRTPFYPGADRHFAPTQPNFLRLHRVNVLPSSRCVDHTS
jgi:hypothetical protein